MAGSSTTMSIPAGSQVEISISSDVYSGQGLFPMAADKTIKLQGKDRDHILGFISENEEAGTIGPVSGGDLMITYKHINNIENRIHFFSAAGDHSIISIISIPIHDHSSIHQGGPAYGTYHYDAQPEPTQT